MMNSNAWQTLIFLTIGNDKDSWPPLQGFLQILVLFFIRSKGEHVSPVLPSVCLLTVREWVLLRCNFISWIVHVGYTNVVIWGHYSHSCTNTIWSTYCGAADWFWVNYHFFTIRVLCYRREVCVRRLHLYLYSITEYRFQLPFSK